MVVRFGQFTVRRLTHSNNLHVKVKSISSQRVVTVENHRILFDPVDGHNHGSLRRLNLKAHAYFQIRGLLEPVLRHRKDKGFIPLSVTISRSNIKGKLVPILSTFQGSFKPIYHVAHSLNIRQRRAIPGAIENLTCVVCQGILYRDRLVFRDLHTVSSEMKILTKKGASIARVS